MTRLEKIAVETLTCKRCNAEPHQRCVTTSWATASRTHEARLRPLTAAWRVGYHEGGTTVIEHIERVCSPDRADLDPRGTLDRTLARVKGWFS